MTTRWNLFLSVALALAFLAACTPPAAPTPVVTKAPPAPPPPTRAAKPVPKAGVTAAPTPRVTVKATPAPKSQQRPETAPFYEGKTIEMAVGSTAGGGTDTAGRITAVYLPKYIPGNPKIIVRNVPGTQGAVAANIFFGKGEPDGLSLMQNSSGSLSLQLKRDPIVKYDLTKLKHIGNIARAGSVLFVRKGLKDRILDHSARPLVVSTGGGSESWQAMPLWAKEFLGWNVRWISGFAGTSEMELAFRRGEVDMLATANAFIIRRLVDEGLAELVTTEGAFRGGRFGRRPDFPDVPTFVEVLGSKKPEGLPWQAYLAWVGPALVDKYLSAPPETPDNVVSILVNAYEKMGQDPEFDAMVKKAVTDVYDVNTGKEINELIQQALNVPPEAVQYGKDLQIKYGIVTR